MGSALLVLLIYYLVWGWHLGNAWEQKNLQRIWFVLYFIWRIILCSFFPLSFLSFLLSGCEGQSELGRDLEGLNGVGLLWGQEPIARLASSHLKKKLFIIFGWAGYLFLWGLFFFLFTMKQSLLLFATLFIFYLKDNYFTENSKIL